MVIFYNLVILIPLINWEIIGIQQHVSLTGRQMYILRMFLWKQVLFWSFILVTTPAKRIKNQDHCLDPSDQKPERHADKAKVFYLVWIIWVTLPISQFVLIIQSSLGLKVNNFWNPFSLAITGLILHKNNKSVKTSLSCLLSSVFQLGNGREALGTQF